MAGSIFRESAGEPLHLFGVGLVQFIELRLFFPLTLSSSLVLLVAAAKQRIFDRADPKVAYCSQREQPTASYLRL